MTTKTETTTHADSTTGSGVLSRWLSFRRKRFWAIVGVLLYTLLGFVAVPLVVKKTLLAMVQEDLGRTAQIQKVEFNPYALSFRIQGLQVNDKDSVKLASFEEFFVNLQVSSLFKQAWTFHEIRLINPYLYFERFKDGNSRLDQLVTDFVASQPAAEVVEDDVAEVGGVPQLLIHRLFLDGGHLQVKDNVPDTPVEVQVAPIKLSIFELATIPNHQGRQTVSISLPHDASLMWSGELTLVPFTSQGELVLDGLHLDPVRNYLMSVLPLHSLNLKLSSQLQYDISTDSDGELSVAVDDISVSLDDFAVSGLSPSTELVNIPETLLQGGSFRYPEQSVHFDKFSIENPKLNIWLNADGSINLMSLMSAPTENSTDIKSDNTGDNVAELTDPEEQQAEPVAWDISLEQFTLTGGGLTFADKSIQPNAAVDIADLTVSISELNSRDNSTMPFSVKGKLAQGGLYKLDGSIVVLPDLSLTAKASIQGLPLSLAQPYLQQSARIILKEGVVNSEANVALPADGNINVDGSIQIANLKIDDSIENKPLLGWNKLDVANFQFNDNGVHLSRLDLDKLFAQILVNADKSTNLSELMVEPGAAQGAVTSGQQGETKAGDSNVAGSDIKENVVKDQAATSQPEKSRPVKEQVTDDSAKHAAMNVVIDGVGIHDGTIKFADLSLPLPFVTLIENLNGSISTIATSSSEPTNINLEGQVNQYGLSRIKGTMDLMDPLHHTNLALDFQNLRIPKLSPYTIEFAGHAIDKGKLDLKLGYVIEQGQLKGSNDIVVTDLELGKKIDHPGAADLPLGLAIALLKDSSGVIDLDLPVKGDVNDPEFDIGSVVGQAFATLITKIVTSPFSLLGSLVGIESDDFGDIQFLAGRDDLTPPQLEKVVQLEQALQKRPNLVVGITGVSSRAIDAPALQTRKLNADVNERKQGQPAAQARLAVHNDQPPIMDKETITLLETLFVERFPTQPVADIKHNYITSPPADNPKAAPQLDRPAYGNDLWRRLLTLEIISDQQLNDLARARARTVVASFLASGPINEKRLEINDPKLVAKKEGDWVVLQLEIASD